MGKTQDQARMRGFAMTPPVSEGYWAQVWPPHSPEGLALLEEKKREWLAKLCMWHPSFIPRGKAGWALHHVLSKRSSQHASFSQTN